MSEAWPSVALREVALINTESLGAATPASFAFQYIDISCVERGRIDWHQTTQVTFGSAPSRARRVLKPGDVLLCTVRPGLQAHAFADWTAKKNVVCSTGFAVIRAGTSLHPRFLFHVIFGESISKQIRCREVGSNYPAINESDVRQLELPLPPLTEQKRVAEVLDAADGAIGRSEAVIAKLRLMKAGLIHDLLTRGLADCGRGGVRQVRADDKADLDIPPLRDPVAHPDQFKETLLGLVPKCWEVCRLDGVGLWMSGGTPSKSNGSFWDGSIPWVTPKDMKVFHLANTTDYLTTAGAASGSRIAPTGSIFVVVRGMILAHTFPVCIAPHPMAFNQDVKAVIPGEGVNSTFLGYWFVNAAKKLLGLTTEATHGTKRFDMADIYACQIALPHPEEQAVIVRILESHHARLRAEEMYRDKLVLQKQGLMSDLLTGRVRLSV